MSPPLARLVACRRVERTLWAPLVVAALAACQGAPSPRPGAAEAGREAALAPPTVPRPNPASPQKNAPPLGDVAPQEAPPQRDVAALRVRAEGQLGPGENTLFVDIAPPEGAKLTLESPLSVRGSGGIGLEFPRRLSGSLGEHPMPLRLPIDVADGATGPARLELTYYWCTEGDEAACRREQAHLDVVLDLSGSGAGGEALISYRAPGPS